MTATTISLVKCRFGFHKWRRIRRTHQNGWMGRICECCGATQTLSWRLKLISGHSGYVDDAKRSLDAIERVAGGNKPMPWDHRKGEQ